MPFRRCLPFAASTLALVGCQGWLAGQTTEPVVAPVAADGVVIRGQSPPLAPGGTVYVAPGELACDVPPPIGYEVIVPQPVFVAPPSPPAAAVPSPDASLLGVIPSEGGAISPDFGLPRGPSVDDRLPNPLYVAVPGATQRIDATWETLADTVAQTFPIRSEQRVQLTGGVMTEGRFETQWQTAATIFEPWRRDTVGSFNRWQSTLQTLRRRAIVRVTPAAGGYEIGVRVDKQLEDLDRPELATAGAASLRNDSSLPSDRVNPINRVRGSERWIDIGRDEPLEQALLRRFRERLTEG